jgi:hypothetical protein
MLIEQSNGLCIEEADLIKRRAAQYIVRTKSRIHECLMQRDLSTAQCLRNELDRYKVILIAHNLLELAELCDNQVIY